VPQRWSVKQPLNLSPVFAGQPLVSRKVERYLAVSFMEYDPGYIDLEEKTLQLFKTLLARTCYLCSRYQSTPYQLWVRAGDRIDWSAL